VAAAVSRNAELNLPFLPALKNFALLFEELRREERKAKKQNYGRKKELLKYEWIKTMQAAQHPPCASFSPPQRALRGGLAPAGRRSKNHHLKHHKVPAIMIRIEYTSTQSSPPFRRGQEGRKIKLTYGYCCSNLGVNSLFDKLPFGYSSYEGHQLRAFPRNYLSYRTGKNFAGNLPKGELRLKSSPLFFG